MPRNEKEATMLDSKVILVASQRQYTANTFYAPWKKPITVQNSVNSAPCYDEKVYHRVDLAHVADRLAATRIPLSNIRSLRVWACDSSTWHITKVNVHRCQLLQALNATHTQL